MYKIYLDKEIISSNRKWKKLMNYQDSETIIYKGFSDLILKLEFTDKNIIFFSDFKSQNDCYEKIKLLRGKFPRIVVNVVTNNKLDIGKLKRVGVNEIIKINRSKEIMLVMQQSLKLADAYANENFVHVRDNKQLVNKREVNLITVLGPTGGVGKTTIATNLAASYAEFGLKVCLVDYSLQFGDVGLFTDVKPVFTVYDLVVNNLDSNPNLNLFLEHINPNLFVLPAPVLPEQADYITRTMTAKLIKILSMAFDVIIFDTAAIMNDLNLELLKVSQQTVLVTTKDLAALKNTKLLMDILIKLNVDDRVKVVINKADSPKYAIDTEIVKRMLGVDIISLIPTNDEVAFNSINLGVPFIYSYPNEKISDEVRSLMSTVRYNCIVGEYKVEKK